MGTIDGTNWSEVTIDGTNVQTITVDGNIAWEAYNKHVRDMIIKYDHPDSAWDETYPLTPSDDPRWSYASGSGTFEGEFSTQDRSYIKEFSGNESITPIVLERSSLKSTKRFKFTYAGMNIDFHIKFYDTDTSSTSEHIDLTHTEEEYDYDIEAYVDYLTLNGAGKFRKDQGGQSGDMDYITLEFDYDNQRARIYGMYGNDRGPGDWVSLSQNASGFDKVEISATNKSQYARTMYLGDIGDTDRRWE